MKLGSLVVYGWNYKEDEYHSKPEKFGLIVGEMKDALDVTTERLVKDNNSNKWDVEIHEGSESVDVMWDNGSVEECSVENLFEVGTCQIGI